MQYDFTLPANGGQQFDAKGKFIKYIAGTGKIRVRFSRGDYVDLLPGQGVRDLTFDSFQVQDRTGSGNVGVVLAGDFSFRDDRISGTVDVVDGGKSRTIANTAFMGLAYQPGVAANYSHVQIWNPVGSGRVIYLEQITMTTTGTTNLNLYTSAAALATLSGNPLAKKVGGSASAMQYYRGAYAAAQGTAIGALDPTQKSYKFSEPLLLMPGAGLAILNATLGNDLGATFEHFEEAQ